MATIVFSGGHELAVSDSTEDLLTRLGNDNVMTVQARHLRVQGWMLVSAASGSEQYPVNTFSIAYIKP